MSSCVPNTTFCGFFFRFQDEAEVQKKDDADDENDEGFDESAEQDEDNEDGNSIEVKKTKSN